MVPTAVNSWPNSSCSSRASSRSVDSRVVMSVRASSWRASDSADSSPKSRRFEANQQQAGGDDGPQRGGQEPVGLALDPVVDGLGLPRGLFLALVVLHQQTRHGGADGRLPCLQRQLHLRARLRFLARVGEREDAIRRRPRTAARRWPDTGAAPAPGRPRPLLPGAPARRPDRGECARTATPTPTADTGSRCPACRASPAPAGSDRSGRAAAAATRAGCDRSARSAAGAGRRSVPRRTTNTQPR